jgi:AraC-like DNA-binding protein
MHTIVPILGIEALDANLLLKDRIFRLIGDCGHEYRIVNESNFLELSTADPLTVRVPCMITIRGTADSALMDFWLREFAGVFPSAIHIAGDATHITAELYTRREALSLGGAARAPETVREATKLTYKYLNRASLDVPFLAQQLAVSKASFERAFMEWGKPGAWNNVRRIRMIEAHNLIRSTRAPIKKIAEAVGWESDSAFADAFHRFWGAPPSAFRKSAPELWRSLQIPLKAIVAH